ncbi:hypothetical protein HYPSUDRAFT_1081361 [Hypholoma sublateritium FD-334 SS-4]|uniref:HTH psq-type domain-containing protein n=1 Tax=Hypholoma sublateritium (strain FD-334 SS-4) TaxID=945553 RepID=A0A0D2NX62_HYPSF|nr:hypothetical protein HYPSUDRAFT_1081361 [Hypholoma sublateritium FD-334 SS-4]
MLAAEAYKKAKNSDLSKKSLRDIAYTFNVNYSTLSRRVHNKGQSLLKSREKNLKITAAEEAILVEFILESADHGFPPSHRQVEKYTNAILKSRQGPNCKMVGS